MRYFIITFGCQLNRSDSERIASVLEKIGYKKSPDIEKTDLLLVNMCSVRQSAVDRVYGIAARFEELRTTNYKLKTILTGCVLKADRKKFADKFDFVFNIEDLPKLPKILNAKCPILDTRDYLKIKPKYQNKFSAFVPIMTGCNNFCSYCAVPYTRGREISRPAKEILSEIKNIIKGGLNPIRNEISNGAREIWLLGQNVNSYKDGKINFPKLLKRVDEIKGNYWIRFTSPHPKDFSDELIEVMVKSQKVTPYLNLPAQSGDNEILRKMNRPYKIEKYKSIIRKIRKRIPGISLSTDIIVGFPGETKKQFENTVKLFKEIKYDMAYIAQYSLRPGTAAAKLKDGVSKKEKERRWKILTNILKKTALEKNKKYIGKEVEVLPEEYKNGFLIGKTRSYKTVRFEGKRNLIGKIVNLKIISAMPWGLEGTLL